MSFESSLLEAARGMLAAGTPAEYVDAFRRCFAQGELDESEIVPTVEQVTGRAPRSFEPWAREHAGAFAP